MLPALVLGDTSAEPATTVADFKVSGLTHLTAVSGANVSIVCGAACCRRSWWARIWRPGWRCSAHRVRARRGTVGQWLRAAVIGRIGLFAVLTHRRRQADPALAANG
jgi:competence protein ComEC